MKLKAGLLAIFCVLVPLLFVGCISGVDGHLHGGIPIGKDKIQSRYERSISQINAAAKVVLSRNGQLIADNTVSNVIQAKVDTCNVWILIEEEKSNISKLTIQVRTPRGVANIELASEIDKQIALELATSGH